MQGIREGIFGDIALSHGRVNAEQAVGFRRIVLEKPWVPVRQLLSDAGLPAVVEYVNHLEVIQACGYLVRQGELTMAQLEDAFALQADTGLHLGHVLTRQLGYCSDTQFLDARARQRQLHLEAEEAMACAS